MVNLTLEPRQAEILLKAAFCGIDNVERFAELLKVEDMEVLLTCTVIVCKVIGQVGCDSQDVKEIMDKARLKRGLPRK